ncbi:hypothetical protein SAMN05216330_11564 [Bradyrhizobium sp. Ghvi]|nr:hypothetical protein SAMN05216330_11564 [Bradyrhizobium sp. Ghvi]
MRVTAFDLCDKMGTSSDCELALRDLPSTNKLLLRWLVKSSRLAGHASYRRRYV